MRHMFRILHLAMLLCVVLLPEVAMAEDDADRFPLIRKTAEPQDFPIESSGMDFSSVSPEAVIWNENRASVPEFALAAVFESFDQVYIGYDPLNRDRYEVRVYVGTLIPERYANAVDYARLLASVWGNTNFGVKTHTAAFGEVLGGDNSRGIMEVNRISVVRRGTEILVIRSKFQAEHYDTYADTIATFVGSIQLEQDPGPALPPGIVKPAPPQAGAQGFSYDVPAGWEQQPLAPPADLSGSFQLWTDAADPNGNSGMLVAVLPPAGDRIQTSIEVQPMADLAANFALLMTKTLLPDAEVGLEPQVMNELGEFSDITAFNRLFTFKVTIDGTEAAATVFVGIGPDGTGIVAPMLTTLPTDLYLTGTRNHGNFALSRVIRAAEAHWAAAD